MQSGAAATTGAGHIVGRKMLLHKMEGGNLFHWSIDYLSSSHRFQLFKYLGQRFQYGLVDDTEIRTP